MSFTPPSRTGSPSAVRRLGRLILLLAGFAGAGLPCFSPAQAAAWAAPIPTPYAPPSTSASGAQAAHADLAAAALPAPMPDFRLRDANANSPRNGTLVSPRDYRLQISAFYFGDAG